MKLSTLRNKLIKKANEYSNFSIEINRASPSNFDFTLDNNKIYSELKYLLDPFAFLVQINIDADFIKIKGKTQDIFTLEKVIKGIFPNASMIGNHIYINFYVTKEFNILNFLNKVKPIINNFHIQNLFTKMNKFNYFTLNLMPSNDEFEILSDLIEEETGIKPELDFSTNIVKTYKINMVDKKQ